MEYFCAVNAADLTPLKTELVDLVSSCLMKEPPYEAVRPEQVAQHHPRQHAEGASPRPQSTVDDGVATVMHMRELVHLISRQDGEFVLKLALYTRRTLHLRSSPNYLVALCAREPNCIPFLQPYMEKIVLIPSDWLAIANYAFFYDCDAAHDFSGLLAQHGAMIEAREERKEATMVTSHASNGFACSPATATHTSASPRDSPVGRATPSWDNRGPRSTSRHEKRRKTLGKAAKVDPTRSYLPAALRASLVHCFSQFTPLSLSKYDNEAAEHRAHRKARRLLAQQQSYERDASCGDSDDSSNGSDGEDGDDPGKTTKGGAELPPDEPQRRRKLTFTYKLLIRKLHITQPAFLVCCLLGKKYPSDEKTFRAMGLHLTDPTWRPPRPVSTHVASKTTPVGDGEEEQRASTTEEAGTENATADASLQPYCVFNGALSGKRMRLPVVQSWETRLSKEGNTGKVWDSLIAARAVGYMALLRNLRNILTRTCSAATHRLVLEKLADEQQIALSQQLPYRFYSAYLAVKEVREMASLLAHPLPAASPKTGAARATTARGSRGGRGRGSPRGRGGRDGPVNPATKLSEMDERITRAYAGFEAPAASRRFIYRYLNRYAAAIDAAINTAARLNVIPMNGTSIVVLCVTQALLEPMSATGGTAETASFQRKIDVAALLIAMLMRSCEQCVVLLYCYDEYVMFREEDFASLPGGVAEGATGNASDDSDSRTCASGDQGVSSHADDFGDGRCDGAGSSDSTATDTSASSRSQQTRRRLSFMRLVDALVTESSRLLVRKMSIEVIRAQNLVATSFNMFAEGSGAQFPYAFLDEVIERSMRVESLLVFDEGVHRTYAHMNRNAPAFGDLPTYLSRLRRICSPDLVYVGVNLRASNPPPPPSQRTSDRAATLALQRAAVRARFHHHNDLLLTGFSDAILRLVAERMGGGALPVIERVAETYQVARFSARANQVALAERAKALKIVSALRESEEDEVKKTVKTGSRRAGLGSTTASSRDAQATIALLGGTDAANPADALDSPHFHPCTPTSSQRHTSTLASTAAVVLPSFDAQGKAITSAACEVDWGHRTRRSERQLQQLTGSSVGLTSSSASTAPSTAGGIEFAATSGAATLPSIRRLFSKRSTIDGDGVDVKPYVSSSGSGGGHPWSLDSVAFHQQPHQVQQPPHDHHTGGGTGVVDTDEAAWLAPQGKHVSPIYHPQPFISLVKLLSTSAAPTSAGVSADGTSSAAAAQGERASKGRHSRGSRTPSPSSRSCLQPSLEPQHDDAARHRSTTPSSTCARPLSPVSLSPQPKKATKTKTVAASAAPGAPFGVARRLLTSYRVCRFFISSTFLDMNNERNAITLDIFPRLRRWAAEAGLKVTLLEVDLRWGIPAAATARNLSTSVCLNEVSRCSPFFLGMLGSRYGSCPPTPLQLVVDEDVETEDYDWMAQLTDPHVSVTELEMRHAMYNTRRRLSRDDTPTALFFARDHNHLMTTFSPADTAARRVYESDSPTAAQSILALKQRIVADGYSLISYNATYTAPSGDGASGRDAIVPVNTTSSNDHINGSNSGGAEGSGTGEEGRHRSGTAAQQSSTRAMLEDDLGRWAVRGGRALDAVGPTSHTTDSNSKSADSLSSFVKARINETEEPKLLTSMDVPLDMSDFSTKVFHALQAVIQQVCGVRVDENSNDNTNSINSDAAVTAQTSTHSEADTSRRSIAERNPSVAASFPPSASAVCGSAGLFETLIVAQSEYARKLSALYAAPRGLLEQLSSFAVAGTMGASTPLSPTMQEEQEPTRRHPLSPAADVHGRRPDHHLRAASNLGDGAPSSNARSQGTSSAAAASQDGHSSTGAATTSTTQPRSESPGRQRTRSNQPTNNNHSGGTRKQHTRHASTSSILVVEGGDGDGKSSTLAALTERILRPMHSAVIPAEARPFLFYSTQAGDDSVRSLLIFLAMSYRTVFQLYAEISVQESDSVEQLLLALDQAYATIHRRYETSAVSSGSGDDDATAGPAALVVILDGLDKSSESAELVSLLGTVLHPLAAPHIRFIISACPRSPLSCALRTRTPAAHVVPLPLLSEGERAQLVRLHLAAYGKLLDESFSADELKELLRKAGAGRPSCLISAITYLRLFSTFATLREDIRALPASPTQLFVKFFHQLQARFDGPTCRLVLTLLLLRHPVGGVMEYNLYRLVSNVAVASRLVALLRGICVDSHRGRLFITSAAFVAAVAQTFLPFASDYQAAQERVLVAELRYQPVDMTMDEQEVRQALRRIREAIERNAADPLSPCLFNPLRYAPRELLGVLQGSVQASRLDITATLVCNLPFLECLTMNRRVLAQLLGLLSSVLHATKHSSGDAENRDGAHCDEVELTNDADAVGSVAGAAYVSGNVPLQWRHYRNEVKRIGNVLDFLQTHYHILLRQPSLLRQCVWNALARDSCISAYDLASAARLRSALQQVSSSAAASVASVTSGVPDSNTQQNKSNAEAHRAGEKNSTSPSTPPVPSAEALSTLWVHWLNLRQHGGETRVLLTTASPQAIRCMAISPDESEVALGSDDGFVRRVCASERGDALPQSQRGGAERPSGGGTDGGRSHIASTLRHESAVSAIVYVPQPASGGASTSNFTGCGFGSGAGSLVSSSATTPQLLVSGCARGIVYVWNLEDNSLLQRGTGHLRSISGLACHPLEPTVLCSCSHDSYVMLWNLCGATSQLSDEVTSAIALRLPKYPANSPERLRQQRMLSGGTNSRSVGDGGRGATAVFQSSLASRSTAAHPGYLTPLVAFHTERQHRSPVSCVGFHNTGDIMASGSWDGSLLLYKTRELVTPPAVVPDAPPPPPVTLATVTGRGRGTATQTKPQVWRVRHGSEYRQVAFRSAEFDLESPVRSLSFSSSLAVTCVAGCHNGAVVVVDYASRAVVARWTSLHTAPLTRVLTSPDGRCVASADEHGVVRLTYMGISGSAFATLHGHHGAVTGLAFRAPLDSAAEALQTPVPMLLTAGDDRTLQAWRVNSGSGPEAMSSTRGLMTSHSTTVTAVATSADGQKLVTGSADGTAIVFCAPEEDSTMTAEWTSEDASGVGILRSYTAYQNRGEASGAAVLFGSKSSVATAAVAAARQGCSAARSMTPSFVLRHDDCRITCVQFALKDTRIVVGVVFGLVYVWSSAPGLNSVEGRLLLRVRVPEHGLYPVVSLGVRESGTAAAGCAPPARPESAHAVFDSLSEAHFAVKGGVHATTSTRPSHLTTTLAGTADVMGASIGTVFVTAVCANGDVAVLRLLSDAASRVMAADKDRRRHQQRRSSCCSATQFPPRTGSFSGSSSGGTLFDYTARTSSSVFAVAAAAAADVSEVANTGEADTVEAGYTLCSPSVEVCGETVPFPLVGSCAAPSPPAQARKAGHLVIAEVRRKRHDEAAASPRLPAALVASSDHFLRSCASVPARVQIARRRMLDRRAMKLQRLLARCHQNEAELRESFQLDLRRHRLAWANSADAEEIVAVVWLCGETDAIAEFDPRQVPTPPPQTRLTNEIETRCAEGASSGGENRHRKLALIVTHRALFLMLSSGYESTVSSGLNIQVSHLTSDTAVVLTNSDPMPEEGAEAAVAGAREASGDEGADDESHGNAPATHDAATHNIPREMKVGVDSLLSEGEYFTAASSAVLVAASQQQSSGALAPVAEHRNATPEAETAAAVAPSIPLLSNAFVVALTTSRGEVLLLRVRVPQVHRRHSPAAQGAEDAKTTTSAVDLQLREQVLPSTQVHLCQRLSFTKAASSISADAVGSSEADAMRSGSETVVGPAAAQRTSITPLASAVQLSPLPDILGMALPHPFTYGKENELAAPPTGPRTVQQVVLVAGCSDGSTRVWIVPTSSAVRLSTLTFPTATSTYAHCADVPVGCFFCSSAVSVVSPLQLPMPARQVRRSFLRLSARPLPAVLLPRWVVGDTLGNVYQLQLDHNAPGGVAAMLLQCLAMQQTEKKEKCAPSQFLSAMQRDGGVHNNDGSHALLRELVVAAGSADARPWISSLQRLVGMLDCPPSAQLLQTLLSSPSTAETRAGFPNSNATTTPCRGSGANGGETASWSTMSASQSPADWLITVEFSLPVASILLKRSRTTALSSASAVDGTAHIPLPCAVAASDPVRRSLPAQEWLTLPSLPPVLRVSSFPSPLSITYASAPGPHPPGPSNTGDIAFELNSGVVKLLSASPSVLPSFGSTQPLQPLRNPLLATEASHDESDGDAAAGGAPLSLPMEAPLSEVLAAYRHSTHNGGRDRDFEGEMARLATVFGPLGTSASAQTNTAAKVGASIPPAPQQQQQQQYTIPCLGTQFAAVSSTPLPSAGEVIGAQSALRALAVSRSAATATKPPVSFDLRPLSVASPSALSAPPGATGSALDAAAALHTDPVAASSTTVCEREEEDEDYFGILYKTGPPLLPSGSLKIAESKRVWLLRQQEVLREATRVQRYNKEARAALKAYQQRVTSALGVQ
jgi:WD40 repeat protein